MTLLGVMNSLYILSILPVVNLTHQQAHRILIYLYGHGAYRLSFTPLVANHYMFEILLTYYDPGMLQLSSDLRKVTVRIKLGHATNKLLC